MRLRQLFQSILVVFILFNVSQAQRDGIPNAGANEIKLRIVSEGDRPFGAPLTVQLISAGGTPLAEGMSNDRGEVSFRGVPPGEYRVRVTGAGVKETEADLTMAEMSLTQFVRVATKAGQPATMGLGFVSTSSLAVPDKAKREFEKGARALEENNLGTARKHLEKAVSLSPGYAAALNDLGIVAARTNEHEKAFQYFSQAVSSDPTHVQALMNLAKAHMMKKELSAAVPWLNKAAKLAPADAQPFNLLAIAQVQTGDLDNALANARRVHDLDHAPYAISHFIAAQVLAQKGVKDEAIREYETFLKESPTSPSAKVAKAELEKLAKLP